MGQLQAQERKFVTLCILCASRAYILRDTSTKATSNANSSLTVFPHCLLLQTVLPLDCYFTLTGLFCSPLSIASLRLPLSTHPLSSLGPSFPRPLPVSREVLPLGPLCEFRAKAAKEILWPAHTHTKHNEWPHSVTQIPVVVVFRNWRKKNYFQDKSATNRNFQILYRQLFLYIYIYTYIYI